MKHSLYIHSFETILPSHHLPQSDLVEWTLKAHQKVMSFSKKPDEVEASRRALLRFALNDKYIKQRYFECHEVDESWEEHEIYKITRETPEGATIEKRNLYFHKIAEQIFGKIYKSKIPFHVVHVTCTGYLSPSPPQSFFSKVNQRPLITHAYHMGCYASLPAIRVAMGLALSEDSEVDIVHNEICSLHFDPSRHTPEQMVVQTLFADGHAKYSVSEKPGGMRILTVVEKLVPDSLEDMTWIPSSHGMRMTLSREVPLKIKDALPIFISELCEKANVSKERVLRDGIFAVHPGGPKIIEAVQKKLELEDEQVSFGKKVLFERGNMSSATLPHIWKEIMDSRPEKGTNVISLAFGPGLTIFGAIFEVCE